MGLYSIFRFVVPAMGLLIPPMSAQPGEWEERGRHFLSRTDFITEDLFAANQLSLMAQRFRAEVAGTYSFAQLRLARNSAEAAEAIGKGMTDIDVRWWAQEYNKQSRRPFPFARVTVAGEDCVVQLRDKEGKIDRFLCGRGDPLLVSVAGKRFEILHVLASYNDDEYSRHIYAGPIKVTAYVESEERSSSPQPETAPWLYLAKLFGTKDLNVSVRPDLWFIVNEGFPVVYPFRSATPIPGELSARLGGWDSSCYGTKRKLLCVSGYPDSELFTEYDLIGNRRTKPKPGWKAPEQR